MRGRGQRNAFETGQHDNGGERRVPDAFDAAREPYSGVQIKGSIVVTSHALFP